MGIHETDQPASVGVSELAATAAGVDLEASGLAATVAGVSVDASVDVEVSGTDKTIASAGPLPGAVVTGLEKTAAPRDARVEATRARATRAGAELERGAVIGRYVVLRKLGAGGMGVVFAAFDPELDRKVALKLLHPEARGASRSAGGSAGRARLLREAQALAKLAHPNVVAIHDVGEHETAVWLAMEYIDGETLGAWMERRDARRSWRDVLELMEAAGRGLAAAHEAKLLHRDFKPESRPPSPELPQPADRSLTHGFGRSGGGGFPFSVP